MDAKTLEALKASIAKWERNAEAKTPEDVRLGSDECPLCDVFNTGKYEQRCVGCPIFQSTGRRFCFGTPYQKARDEIHRWWRDENNNQAFASAARDEVAFLKSLLPAQTEALCSDCPPIGYSTDITRCSPCPRRADGGRQP